MPEEYSPAKVVLARKKLLIMMMMPIGVVLLATFVFYTGIGMPDGTRNKGILISPPVQIDDIGLQDISHKSYKWNANTKDKWSFMMAHAAACDDVCRQQFWEVRQTRTALGKYADNIQRVWLVTDGVLDDNTRQWLAKEHKDMVVLYAVLDDWRSLVGKAPEGERALTAARFFVVDARGFVMMYYLPQDSYKDVITDMKFLLRGIE
jgi:cytochrome oxidase Cu insertion factor (SCO1/SenC/PrrC family)